MNLRPLLETMMGRPEPDYGYDVSPAPDDISQIAEVTAITQKAKYLYDSLGGCYFSFIGVGVD